MARRLAVAADHAGATLKAAIVARVAEVAPEWSVADLGGDGSDPTDDYPDSARAVAERMIAGEADRGLVICGSGIGVTIAANKFNGIRASIAHDPASARQGVVHDDMNVLAFGANLISLETALETLAAFLQSEPSSEERYLRRTAKVADIEEEQS